MLLCSKEAFDMCQSAARCGLRETATCMEGSECDAFNQAVKAMPKQKTNADRIRAMNIYQLAVFLAKIKGDVEYDDNLVVAYSAQDMAKNLDWLNRPLQHPGDDDRHEHSGLLED